MFHSLHLQLITFVLHIEAETLTYKSLEYTDPSGKHINFE